jgi:hypothetical protein
LRTYPLRSRSSRVSTARFAKVLGPDPTVADLVLSLPGFLAAADLRAFLSRLRRARTRKRPILAGCGGHVIKVGLTPVLVDLMKSGWLTGLALNGAGIVHDFEVAYAGRTSEDVASEVRTGRFGMARETGVWLNAAIREAAAAGLGLGEAVGRMISRSRFPYRRLSLVANAYELGVPVTVHVAVGTDIIHFHPGADGAALGETSLRDFFRFCALLAAGDGGGAYLNIGSAVILPEVFLKAVSFVRNKGARLDDLTTAVFDFNRHYRPEQNVVLRPLGPRGRGFYFVGPHELLVPLLAAALKSRRT